MSALAAATLARRELVRFFRQPSRVVGALGSPLLFWLVIGSGLSGAFRLPGGPAEVDYLHYFFPGITVLVVLFTAIFASISVIEDRQEGFLQGVLVAPVGAASVVAGKIAGGALIAWLQGLLLLALAPLAGIALTPQSFLLSAGMLALLSLCLTAVGFAFAWRVDSTQGFHAVMNLVLVPGWLLSGAFFPLSSAPAWMQWAMRANPLTYGMDALRRLLDPAAVDPGSPALGVAFAVTLLFTLAAFAAAWLSVARRRAP